MILKQREERMNKMIELNKIYNENCLETMARMPDNFIDCCVTSPPYYGLRDYGHKDQIGLEETPELYIQKLVKVFREVKRVLKLDGSLWLNLGDSYFGGGGASGHTSETKNIGRKTESYGAVKTANRKSDYLKPKDLIGIPWLVAFALRADGWYLRQDIIWHKPNPMPESVTDRCTKSHEYIFLLTKSAKYYYDSVAIQEVATGYDGRKDIQMHGSTKYANGYFPTEIRSQTIAIKEHARWKRKNDDTNNGGNGIGFQDHSGYNNLDNPYIRNKRSVWTVTTKPFSEAHFATFPEDLIIPCIKAGSCEGGIVYDPFSGAGTTALVSHKLNRKFIGSEINPEYVKIAEKRIAPYLMQQTLEFTP